MQGKGVGRRSLQRAGFLCAVWLCALAGGCHSFYEQPGSSGTGLFAPAPPPVVGGPLAPTTIPPGAIFPPAGTQGPVAAPGASVPVAPAAAAPAIPGQPPVLVSPPVAGDVPRQMIPPGQDWHLTLTPLKVVAPVGSEVLLMAGIQGGDGKPLVNERVEWTLSPQSVGQFLTLGDRGDLLAFRRPRDVPRKVANNYAIGSTSAAPAILARGGAAGNIQVPRGQAWITMTSSTDGTSQVTAFAPGVNSWEQRRQTATIFWVDAQFSFPATVITGVGSRQTLTTMVTRQSDGSPLENWIVRYEVAGGAPAGFGPSGAATLEVPTDAQGRATVEIYQPQQQRGTSQVDVQVVRPALPGTADRRLTIGHGGASVTWTGAEMGMRVTGPTEADVGSTVTYRIEVANSGDLAVTGVSVNSPLPAGTRFVKSSLPASSSQEGLAWQLDRVEPRQSRTIDVDLAVDQPGGVRFCATVSTPAGLRGQNCATTSVLVAALQAKLIGPQTASVGQDVTFHISITNRGTTPLENLVVSDSFDPGLKHPVSASPIERDIGRLDAGQTRDDLGVTFRVTETGRLCQRLEVRGSGVRTAQAEACLTASTAPVQPTPGLVVRKQGPRQLAVGQSGQFDLTVTNTGNTTLRNIKVVDSYQQGLDPKFLTRGYTREEGQLVWQFDSLAPGASQLLRVMAQATSGVNRACTRAVVTAEGGMTRADDTCVEIVPAPAAPPATAPPGGTPTSPPSSPLTPGAAPPSGSAPPPLAPAPSGPTLPGPSGTVPPGATPSPVPPGATPSPVPPGATPSPMPPAATPPTTPPAAATTPAGAGAPAAPADGGGLTVTVTKLQDQVPVGQKVILEITVKNNSPTTADNQVVVTVTAPPGMTPLPLSSGGTAFVPATISGQVMQFAPIKEIHPNEPLVYRVPVRADRAGKFLLQVQMTSQAMPRPISASTEVNCYSEQ